jgi:hypothetical protein
MLIHNADITGLLTINGILYTALDSSNRTPVSNGVHRGSWYATLGGSLTNNVNSYTFTAESEL